MWLHTRIVSVDGVEVQARTTHLWKRFLFKKMCHLTWLSLSLSWRATVVSMVVPGKRAGACADGAEAGTGKSFFRVSSFEVW